MFVFKTGNEDKYSKAHCDFDQPGSSKQSIKSINSRTPKKNVFFAQTLLPLFFMSGYAAANVAESYNGTLPTSYNGTLPTSYNETLPTSYNETLPTSIGDTSETIISCDDLKNFNVRNECKNFISSHEGEFTVRYLPKGQPIKSYDDFTVYILPPGDIPFDDVVEIWGQNIAFIGDSDADGNRPTLRGGSIVMLRFNGCKNCMLANVNVFPIYINTENKPRASMPIVVYGGRSEVELRNISATYPYRSLLTVFSGKSITLDNISITKGSNSALYIHNCDKIKAKNIRLCGISLSEYLPNVIEIGDPVNVELEDISIGLSKSQDPAKYAEYIMIVFDNSDKYSQPGGRKVNVVMKGLHFGIYTGKGSDRNITVPEDWPQSWDVLSLSWCFIGGQEIDFTKINGEIVIVNNDDLRAITSQPEVRPVRGEHYYRNLKVTFTDRISPTPNLSTPTATSGGAERQSLPTLRHSHESGNDDGIILSTVTLIPNSSSSSIYNLTSAPQSLEQTDDDSGYSQWEKIGILGAVAGGVAVIVGYRHRAALGTFIENYSRALAYMRYQSSRLANSIFLYLR